MATTNPAFIPTGSLKLDLALGTGGLPRGRITEISGPESSGKTSLCLQLIANAQKFNRYQAGKNNPSNCAFIDVDGCLDPKQADRYNIMTKHLYVIEPNSAEQALEITKSLAISGTMLLIIIDSINALVSEKEFMVPIGDEWSDTSQELLSQALRKIDRPIRQNGTAVIFTNHTRGTYRPIYHQLSSNPARLALRLHSSVRLGLHLREIIYEDGSAVGQRVQLEILKNRYSPYQHVAELDIMYNVGIDETGELLDLGVKSGVIQIKGNQIIYRGKLLGTDRRMAKSQIDKDSSLRYKIEAAIRQRYLSTVS